MEAAFFEKSTALIFLKLTFLKFLMFSGFLKFFRGFLIFQDFQDFQVFGFRSFSLFHFSMSLCDFSVLEVFHFL